MFQYSPMGHCTDKLTMSLQVCSMEEAEEMMNVVDRNGDGVISFSEFRCMMGANPVML